MQSGTVFGYAAMIDGLCKKLEEELGENATKTETQSDKPVRFVRLGLWRYGPTEACPLAAPFLTPPRL